MQMDEQIRPPVWQMVKEALQYFGREVSYSEIRQFIQNNYGNVNPSTLTCQIIVCSVNHPSRIHYPENKKTRLCNGQYDFLYNTGRGKVAPYDEAKHGVWRIIERSDGSLAVSMESEPVVDDAAASGEVFEGQNSVFALESHLRDYLARNISSIADIGAKLTIFKDGEGRSGVEYQTDVGPVDLLAIDEQGGFWVFELKLGRGPDSALGQILRYMGWVEQHLASGERVQGVILASEISPKLRYAVTQVPHVKLLEYELRFGVRPAQSIA